MNCDCGNIATFKVSTLRTTKFVCDDCVKPYCFSFMWDKEPYPKGRTRSKVKPKTRKRSEPS